MVGSRGTLWLGGQHYLGWEILTHLMLYEHDSLLDDGSWGRSFTTLSTANEACNTGCLSHVKG